MEGVVDTCEESVYNLIPRPQVVLERPPMHRSKFAAATANEPATFASAAPRKAAATFGRANGLAAPDPLSFLRAHAKEPALPAAPPAPGTSPKQRVKPPVPARGDAPLMGLMSDKDWVTANAVEAIASRPPPPRGQLASPAGRPAALAGEADARPTQRPGFGKVPKYLERNKAAVADERRQIEKYLAATCAAAGWRPDSGSGANAPQHQQQQPLNDAERAELLACLKDKWAAVNAAYLKIRFVLDTESSVRRKEALEAELARIEADIQLLSRGDVVIVTNGGGGGGGTAT